MTIKNTLRKHAPTFLFCGIFAIIPVISVVSARPLGSLIPAIALLLLAIDVFTHKKRPAFDVNLALLLTGIAALCLASALWSDWPDRISSQSLKIIYAFLGGYALITLAKQAPANVKEKNLHCMTIAFFLVIVLIIAEQLLGAPLYRLVRGIDFNAHLPKSLTNHAVVVFSLLIWPVLHFLRTTGKKTQARITLALWAIVVVLFGKSATATLAIFVGASVFFLLPLAPKAINRMIGISSSLIVLMMPWVSRFLFENAATPLSAIKGANAAERLEIWNAVSEKIFIKPWTGWGLEASRHFKNLDLQKIYFKETSILHPHNAALQCWVEFGAVGAGLATFACLFTLARIARLPLEEQRTATALFGTAFCVMMVGYGTWQGWWLGALFLAMASFIMAQKKSPSA